VKQALLILLLICVGWLHRGWAQDPFYAHFYDNQALFNPAMVGLNGSLSFNAKYKSQWPANNVSPFISGMVSMEESMPCSLFDYGISLNFDEEGSGRFRSYDFGFRFAGTPAFTVGNSVHNLKLGAAFQWSLKTVDYSKFIFSDELHPKYGPVDVFGNDLPTGFIPPNEGESQVFFTPAIGVAYHWLSNENSERASTIQLGGSVHNAFSIGNSLLGNEESILNIGTKIPVRVNAFARAEFILSNNRRTFWSMGPVFFFQKQGQLQYAEAGIHTSINRYLNGAILYHFSPKTMSGNATNWFTFQVEFGGLISNENRIDLGLSYSNNFSGLRNVVGPMLEFSISYHLAQSPVCKMMGRGDEVPYSNGAKCPTAAFSPGRKKMYDNIW
jgi:type IX secretion system PorP/SprF family membrane protein